MGNQAVKFNLTAFFISKILFFKKKFLYFIKI